jgi:hypothetical protein
MLSGTQKAVCIKSPIYQIKKAQIEDQLFIIYFQCYDVMLIPVCSFIKFKKMYNNNKYLFIIITFV